MKAAPGPDCFKRNSFARCCLDRRCFDDSGAACNNRMNCLHNERASSTDALLSVEFQSH
jgi:hypothetical protein